MNRKFVIITSIYPATEAVRAFAAWPGWTTVVVGDRKSPPDWCSDGVVYLSLEDQLARAPDFCRHLPENTYTRKMVGYLYAFAHGAQAIFESDDDNIPYAGASAVVDGHLARRGALHPALAAGSGWVNIYERFGAQGTWPRGFPMQKLKAADRAIEEQPQALPWGVLQYLADGDPDVDAVYRMVDGGEVHFARERACSLARGSYTPFNSQATLWVPEAFPLMFLPLGVPDRVTDILRGYIALACLWAHDRTLGLASPVVYQVRNVHNLLKDFEQEIDLYRHGDRWSREFQQVSAADTLGDSFRAVLQFLVLQRTLPAMNIEAYGDFLRAALMPSTASAASTHTAELLPTV
jgi:hypothetical protein